VVSALRLLGVLQSARAAARATKQATAAACGEGRVHTRKHCTKAHICYRKECIIN
jgi:hypothetical protein